jgi:hypothetical protein
MEMTADAVAGISAGNLRVPRAEFTAVWSTAERLNQQAGEERVLAWYPAAVAVTCRWLAGAIVEDQFGRRPAESPVSNRSERAYEELIEAEYLAAELLPVRRPGLAQRQPGWGEGVRATLRWVWRRQGPPPLALDAQLARVVPVPPVAHDSACCAGGARSRFPVPPTPTPPPGRR